MFFGAVPLRRRCLRGVAVGLIAVALAAAVFGVLWRPQVATAFQATGTGAWYWQNPLPQGNPLHGISCPTSINCVAVGDVGTIISTQDAGVRWSVSPSSSSSDLSAVSCPTAAICYVVGSGSILKSSDGGLSWMSVGGLNGQKGISCPGALRCFTDGTTGTILATTDGGSVWSILNSGTTTGLSSISCPDVNSCFAVGDAGTILTTTDAGATWVARSSGTPLALLGISCPTTTRCYAVGGLGTIIATINGGALWTAETSGTNQNVYGISCPSSTTCFGVSNGLSIASTTNGGSSWAWQSVSTTSRYTYPTLSSVSCFSASQCFAAGDAGVLVATANSGQSWSLFSNVDTDQLDGLTCLSATTCFAVGAPDQIVTTLDGGEHWFRQHYPPGMGGGQLWAIACPGSQTCVAVGDFVSTTNDAGTTWSNGLVNPACGCQGPSLYTLSCPTANRCFGAGNGGAIYETNDTGQTWTALASGVTDRINGIACWDASDCIAVGEGIKPSFILATSDAGTTWLPLSPATQFAYYLGVSCPAIRTCIVVGDQACCSNDDFLRTVDGGATWTAGASASGEVPLRAITCSSSSICSAVGIASSNLLGTTSVVDTTSDGGMHWSSQALGTRETINAISCPAPSYCYAAGAGGAVLSSFSRGPALQSLATSSPSRSPATQSGAGPTPGPRSAGPKTVAGAPAIRAPHSSAAAGDSVAFHSLVPTEDVVVQLITWVLWLFANLD